MDLITTYFCKASQVGYHGNLFGGRMLGNSIAVSDDVEAITLSEKVKDKYNKKD